MKNTYYITTPIYYVNDVAHIGHSYTTIACDVLARFFRSCGRDVRFLTGTDEHGVKMYKAAQEKQISPQELADRNVVSFQQMWKKLEITNDDFIRTSQPRHKNRVAAIISELVKRDQIYQGNYEGWYDESQEEFVTESTARDNEYKSAISGKPLVKYVETNWFFRLKNWIPKLIAHIEANPNFIRPEARRNEVLSKLKLGVEDLCISRNKSKLPWGVPMPNDPEHVVYVWIDALSNYYTALGVPPIGDEYDNTAGRYWPATVHMIAKDILWFHTVYWPCVLMAMDIPLPQTVFAHGWWVSEGKKMSKSLGNFVSYEKIDEICAEYSTDVFRYFLLRAMNFGQDGDFCMAMLKQCYNSELANGLGNLLNRTTNMIGKYFNGLLPAVGEVGEEDKSVQAAADELRKGAVAAMEACAFHTYLDGIINLINATNRYIDDTAPFKLAKDPARAGRLATVLYTCAEALRIILLAVEPFMPNASKAGLESIGWSRPAEMTLDAAMSWGVLQAGATVTKAAPLFPRKE